MKPHDHSLDEVAGGLADEGFVPTSQPLFRSEALDAASASRMGRPVVLYPLSWTLLSVGLLLLAVLLGLLMIGGTYSRKETVVGVVRNVGGEIRVTAPSSGTVSAVAVSEGQRVKAGDPILTVRTARIGVDNRSVDTVAIESLDLEIASLHSRLAALGEASKAYSRGNAARRAALRSEVAAARTTEQATRQRLALAEAAMLKAEPVARKGFISSESMRRREDEIISFRQAIADGAGRQAGLAGQIGELRAAEEQRPYTLVQERGQLLELIAKARREREAVSAQRGYIVKAPSAGVITALQVSPGQTVDPQRSLMTITSPGAPVTAEIYVPSRAIGFLEKGQRVRVRYDAFPFQRFGAAEGRVQAVSASVLRPDEVQAAVDVREPMYRVLVALERDTLSAYGRRHRIQPGFALTADVILDDRSFASWLLDPLISLKGRL